MPLTRDRAPGRSRWHPDDIVPDVLARPTPLLLALLAILVGAPPESSLLAASSPPSIQDFEANPPAGLRAAGVDDDDDEDWDEDWEAEEADPAETALLEAVIAHQSVPAAPDRTQRRRGASRRGLDDEDRESLLMKSEQRFVELQQAHPGTRAAREAFYWIAECQRELGDHRIALDTYAIARVDDGGGSRAVEVRLGAARARIELEEYEVALERLEEIAGLSPDSSVHAASLYWRGVALRELERFAEAETVWQNLRGLYPNSTASKHAFRDRETLRPARERLAEWVPEYERLKKEYLETPKREQRAAITAIADHLVPYGTAKAPETERYLLSLFDDEVGEIRAAVIAPLLQVGGPRAAQRIIKDVKALDENGVTALMEGLQRKHFSKIRLSVFEEHLHASRRRRAQFAAIDLFGRVGDAKAVSALIEVIPAGAGDDKFSAQQRQVHSRVEGRLRRVRDDKALKVLTRKLGGRGNTMRRAMIADALGYTGSRKVEEALRAAMFDKSSAVASAAVRSLGRLGIDEATADIARLLTQRRGDEQFVKDAVRAIGQLDPTGAEAALIVVSDARDHSIRALVIRNLARIGSGAAIGRIVEAFSDPAWQVRSAAVEACEGLTQPEVVEGLVTLLEREDGVLLPKIVKRLIAILGVDRGPDPAAWREYWEFKRDSYDPGAALAGGEGDGKKGTTFVRRADPDSVSPTYFGVEIISKRIAFVIDVSGSMQAEVSVPNDDGGTSTMRRIDLARDELLRAITTLRPGTVFNIVKFDTNPVTWQEKPVKLSKKSVRGAQRFARDLSPGGATNIYDSLEMVLEAGRVDTIFLLSDGAPSAGRYIEEAAILREITRLNEESQVTIHTIALGFDSGFMRQLAERNKGNYVVAGQ